MKKKLLKHSLFVLLLAMLVTSWTLFYIYIPGSAYAYLFFFGYLVLIFSLVNVFYIKKNSGTVFFVGLWLSSLLCFIPLCTVFWLHGADGLGKFLFSICILLFLFNVGYFIFKIGRKEIKVSLISYTSFLVVSMIVLSIAHTYFYNCMFSQGT